MTKTFCDLCGKECGEDHYFSDKALSAIMTGHEYMGIDVCLGCGDSLHGMMKIIKERAKVEITSVIDKLKAKNRRKYDTTSM